MKFKTAYSKSKYKGKKMSNEVLTVPDQNLSIRTLLDRHSRGLPLGASQKQGEYFETEIPRYDDLVDMFEHKKQLIKQHNDLTKQIETEQAQKKATAEAAEVAKTKPKGIGSETTNVIG
tara:strand:- start:118 stop:474 length:357 start_codon:yes stop_codon:yes gene_type:complete